MTDDKMCVEVPPTVSTTSGSQLPLWGAQRGGLSAGPSFGDGTLSSHRRAFLAGLCLLTDFGFRAHRLAISFCRRPFMEKRLKASEGLVSPKSLRAPPGPIHSFISEKKECRALRLSAIPLPPAYRLKETWSQPKNLTSRVFPCSKGLGGADSCTLYTSL